MMRRLKRRCWSRTFAREARGTAHAYALFHSIIVSRRLKNGIGREYIVAGDASSRALNGLHLQRSDRTESLSRSPRCIPSSTINLREDGGVTSRRWCGASPLVSTYPTPSYSLSSSTARRTMLVRSNLHTSRTSQILQADSTHGSFVTLIVRRKGLNSDAVDNWIGH